MDFQICIGDKDAIGATKRQDVITFSTHALPGSDCRLLLYPKGGGEAIRYIPSA